MTLWIFRLNSKHYLWLNLAERMGYSKTVDKTRANFLTHSLQTCKHQWIGLMTSKSVLDIKSFPIPWTHDEGVPNHGKTLFNGRTVPLGWCANENVLYSISKSIFPQFWTPSPPPSRWTKIYCWKENRTSTLCMDGERGYHMLKSYQSPKP